MPNPILVIEDYCSTKYNIIRYDNLYYAIHQAEGSFDINKINRKELRFPCIVAHRISDIKRKFVNEFSPSESYEIPIVQLHELNKNLKRVDIFKAGGSEIIYLMTDSPPTVCNFRCPYCFHNEKEQWGIGYHPFEDEYNEWVNAVETAIIKIQRPLMLSIGPRGEPLVIPKWWDFLHKVANNSKVLSVSFLSNLSAPIVSKFNEVDIKKIGITATLHPTNFKDPVADFENFYKQVKWLKENGARVVVNYVLTPEQLPHFHVYRSKFSDLGVTMVANLFRGKYKDKTYPDNFTEKELKIIREYLNDDLPFIFNYQSHFLNPFGNKCTAGRYIFFMEYDGSIYNCNFARERLGSIYDDVLYLFDENCYCTVTKCECKWTIPLQEHIVKDYVGIGNIHEFKRRKSSEQGYHPFT